jgi:membrane-associated phospholipid phosphatase
LAFTYAISYMGYLFAPAHGPIVFHARDFQVPLAGGSFHDLVVRGVESTGGLQGVFPSLHVGASVYLCSFDLGTNRLRGLTYLPIVALIYVATVLLRYHYVIDLAAGTLIAITCVYLGRWAVLRWAHDRQRAGLPVVPGEG